MSIHLYLHRPKTVWVARVNNSPALPYPFVSFKYGATVSGSVNAVRQGMTLLLGTAAGKDDLGRLRVSSIDTVTQNIRTGYTGQGASDGLATLVHDSYITVLDEYRIWAKIPFGVDLKDGYIDAGSNLGGYGTAAAPAPVANGGPGYAGTIAPATQRITVTFSAAGSYGFFAGAPSPASVFAWDVADGQITSGTSSSQSITATFPAGFRYVRLTVSFGSPLRTHTKTIPVFGRDPANDLTVKHQILAHNIGRRGQRLQVKILEHLDPAVVPDGCLAMIWEDEFGDSLSRDHMIFIGWHDQEESSWSGSRFGTLMDTTWSLIDAAGKLQRLPAFPLRLEYSIAHIDPPSTWPYTEFNYAFYFLWFLLYWQSTALEVVDFLDASKFTDNFRFLTWASERNNLYDQGNDLAMRLTPDHFLSCNRWGQLAYVADPNLVNYSDRDFYTGGVVAVLATNDATNVRYTGDRTPRVNILRSGAVLSSFAYIDVGGLKTIPTVFSIAPGGSARGQGEQEIESAQRIAITQQQLNWCEGNRFARYNDAKGAIELTFPYVLIPRAAAEPASMKWVQISFGLNSWVWPRPYGTQLSYRGIIEEVNIQYDYSEGGLTRMATLRWIPETWGPAALTRAGGEL